MPAFYLDAGPVSPGALVFPPAGGEMQSGQLLGEMHLPTPVTSALSLVDMMSWLQATVGHSSYSDQKPLEEVCHGWHRGLNAGQRVRFAAIDRSLGWAILVTVAEDGVEGLCSLPFPATKLLLSPSLAPRTFLDKVHPAP